MHNFQHTSIWDDDNEADERGDDTEQLRPGARAFAPPFLDVRSGTPREALPPLRRALLEQARFVVRARALGILHPSSARALSLSNASHHHHRPAQLTTKVRVARPYATPTASAGDRGATRRDSDDDDAAGGASGSSAPRLEEMDFGALVGRRHAVAMPQTRADAYGHAQADGPPRYASCDATALFTGGFIDE